MKANKNYQSRLKRFKNTQGNMNHTMIFSVNRLGITRFDQIGFYKNKKNRLSTINNTIITKNYDRSHKEREERCKTMQNDNKFRIKKTYNNHMLSQQNQIHQQLNINRLRFISLNKSIKMAQEAEFEQYARLTLKNQQLFNTNDSKVKQILPTCNSKVGEVIKKTLEQFETQIKYTANVRNILINKWKPQCRQGHCTVFYNNLIFLVGGHCSLPFCQINIFSIQNQKWIQSIKLDCPRSYHSLIKYRNRFGIIFGGMGVYDPSRKIRVCYNTVTLIDFKTSNFKPMRMKNQSSIQPRRSHSATLFGDFMLVFGGINTQKQYLSDLVYLDLKQMRWYHRQFKIINQYLSEFLVHGIAYHSAVAAFKPRKSYQLFNSSYSQNQSILFFGGQNQHQRQNILCQLKLHEVVPELSIVKFSGPAPSSYYPLAHRHDEDTVIVVSGEANNRAITLYKIMNRSFIHVQLLNNILPGGIKSSLCVDGSSYYILYGITDKGYEGSMKIFEINSQKVNKNQAEKKKTELRFSLILSDDEEDSLNFI